VESANKLLVEARLKGAGMRWAPTSVNPMVALRTIAHSDRWAEAWPLIVSAQQQAQRVHTTQRRTARQEAERAQRAAAQAATAAATTPPSRPPAARTRPAAPAPAHSRKPAPNHPWCHDTLNRRRSA
jgi:hypothetical protein